MVKKTVFDAICLTETSLKSTNTDIPDAFKPSGYKDYSTGTLNSKGGTTIFVKNTHDCTERDDLKILTKEFESVWIEIKRKRGKNIVVGCIYRHPHNNNKTFLTT